MYACQLHLDIKVRNSIGVQIKQAFCDLQSNAPSPEQGRDIIVRRTHVIA